MTNKEIEEKLLLRDTDKNTLYSKNAEMFQKYISKWNDDEYPFQVNDLKRLIRFNEWKKADLEFENELLVRKYLPPFALDIFFEMKEFRSNHRNELSSTQEMYAKLMGLPMNTQDEKAFCLYTYYFEKYFNDSKLNMKEN